MSPVHAWIRIFECCLHISYRLDLKTWRIRGPVNKEKFAERKRQVQQNLWKKLGLRVDKPKSGGSGTTNDGNTARRAFENVEMLSECLGLDSTLLSNFRSILIGVSSHFPLNPDSFEKFCHSTAELFVKLYPWFYMPSSVHKILIHGGQIIRNSTLPLGMLGEEGSESRNKDYKRIRLHHTRKFNRKVTMEDMFFRLIDMSDPIIVNLYSETALKRKVRKPLPKDVLNFLLVPQTNMKDSTTFDVDDEQDSDMDDAEMELEYSTELSDEEEITD